MVTSSPAPVFRNSALLKSPGSRKLKIDKLEREESKMMVARNMESLRDLVNTNASDHHRSLGRASLTQMTSNLSLGAPLFQLEDEAEFGVDTEEQRRLLENFAKYSSSNNIVEQVIDTAAGEDYSDNNSCLEGEEDYTQDEMIDVAPGVTLPLRRSAETWKAIMDGRVIVTPCFCCTQDLTCIEDAELLACSDCWVFSPIEQPNQQHGRRSSGVCIGVRAEDIMEWIQESQQEQQHQQQLR